MGQTSNSAITIPTSPKQQIVPKPSSPSTSSEVPSSSWKSIITKQCKVSQTSKSSKEVAHIRHRRVVQRRMKLFIIVRILLRYLKKVDPILSDKANAVLKDCERKHSSQESRYETLADAIQDRLRDTVGGTHWQKACVIQRQLAADQRKNKGHWFFWDRVE